ncbi:MAG: DUF2235 domain-containing protein [Rhizobacter sp.]|nr:DUF2235 domain-containing protein [Rhizobacter sp.]
MSCPAYQQASAAADLALLHLPAMEPLKAPPTRPRTPMKDANAARRDPPPMSCQQTLTLSFFFDGTGNNVDADVGTWEHSNVARLYRSHKLDDSDRGLYSFYLPGIGTYFKDREVDDPGGTWTGRGFGALGDARLKWAAARLDEKVKEAAARAQNPTNKICWIKVSAFGFSRGAALARAFCRDLQKLCTADAASSTGWHLNAGGYPIEISFLGLWDTVASAGLPPSANNLGRNRWVRALGWMASTAHMLVQPSVLKGLAFGEPGADPAPGWLDGHAGWAKGMAIGGLVKRCVHMVAAHEIRNSFASDSVLYESNPGLFALPPNTVEFVHPGVHSDVGGGYRPGEGGCRPEKGAQLSLIPLRAMHEFALQAEVPLRSLPSMEDEAQKEDFAVDGETAKQYAKTLDLWHHYLKHRASYNLPAARTGLGGEMVRHMRAYYAWRFRAIRMNQEAKRSWRSTPQQLQVEEHEREFAKHRQQVDKELAQAARDLSEAQQHQEIKRMQLEGAQLTAQRLGTPVKAATVQQYEQAKRTTEQKQILFDRQRARETTAANDSSLNASISKYDEMLYEDAKQIVKWMDGDRKLKLRPHYHALVEAYLDEFKRNNGLTDPKVIAFFDDYVHDSLAGFDTDESWPSDPRMVYVGGDRKLRFAVVDPSGFAKGTATA